jgi:hypothetical protein
MKLLLTLLLLAGPGYQSMVKLPAFMMGDSQGKIIQNAALPAHREVILVYFLADCEECRQFTTLIAKDEALLANYEILMITNSNRQALQCFISDLKLAGKKHMLIGTEGLAGPVQRALGVERFPFLAVYGRNRQLLRNFSNAGDMPRLYGELKNFIRQGKNDHR